MVASNASTTARSQKGRSVLGPQKISNNFKVERGKRRVNQTFVPSALAGLSKFRYDNGEQIAKQEVEEDESFRSFLEMLDVDERLFSSQEDVNERASPPGELQDKAGFDEAYRPRKRPVKDSGLWEFSRDLTLLSDTNHHNKVENSGWVLFDGSNSKTKRVRSGVNDSIHTSSTRKTSGVNSGILSSSTPDHETKGRFRMFVHVGANNVVKNTLDDGDSGTLDDDDDQYKIGYGTHHIPE